MLTTAGQFHKELEKLISDAYNDRVERLTGGAPNDYAAYIRIVGYIDGLRTALELAQVAKENAEKR